MRFKLKNKANYPDWKKGKIGDILTIGSGRDYKHLSEGNIPVFGTGGYMTSVDEFLYDGESVCIGRKGTINKPSYLNGKFWTVDTLFYTHSFEDVLPKFVYYIFEQVNWLKYNEASGVPSLSKSTIEQIEVKFPSLGEQEKISSFLSLIDKRIHTQSKIIEQSETLIREFHYQIFKQKLRFSDTDGRDFSEWTEVKIGDILKIGNGKDYKHLQSGKVPVFGTGGFMTSVDEYLYDGETVCIGRKGTIDKPMYYDGKIWTVDTLFYTHSFQSCIPKFIFHLFQTINWLEYNEASGVPSLSKNTIEKITVQLPSIQEQNRIASFLTKIDQKIQTEKAILEQLEMQKKYLLQQIFV